jgi:ABC-type glycerol-3-phosphate transport system substrate-binding protein
MKKILFSLAMVAILLLSACGGKTGGTSANPTQLSFMMWGDPAELTV